MAKTANQIAIELAQSIQTSDPTLDSSQGPIADTMVRPQAGQLADAAADAESLRLLFTLDFSQSASDDEVRRALANYGSSPGSGTQASHIQYFMRFLRPTTDINIPAGTLISSVDGTYVYQVVTPGVITVAGANAFYNPARRTYEVGLLVQATGVGAEFELPPYRVNTILTPIQGIDSTENRVAGGSSQPGLSQESTTGQSDRLLRALKGRNLGGPAGVSSLILDTLPEEVTDVSVVQPTDKEFKRPTNGPAIDIYLLGSSLGSQTDTFKAVAGQTIFSLTKVPAVAILTFTVNGVGGVTTYGLVPDESVETGLSLRANDQLVVGTPLLAGDVVVVTYTYNKVLADVLSQVFGSGDSLLFNTDILLRQPFPVPPRIAGQIKLLPGYAVNDVESNLTAYLSGVLQFTSFQSTIVPETFRQELITKVNGIQSFRITVFQRSTGSLADVEVVAYDKNEVSVYDPSTLAIQVIS